ncbi:MAG: sensor domain-containing diguanylate cyclase [Eubacterium sp.]|nr:sensor domain-containing diguanylate cyclase [Eubacterium sp.]
MRQIVYIDTDSEEGELFLRSTLEDTYELLRIEKTEEVITYLDQYSENVDALIIGHPSRLPDVENLLRFVQNSNSVIFAIPVLIFTDDESRDLDELFLEDPVVDIFRIRQSPVIVKNRIKRASQFANSVSFAEFARMLQVLPSLIYLKDARGRYVFCSQYWHHLDHYDDPEWTIVGKTDVEIRKDTENARKAYESDMQMIQSGIGTSYIIEENEDGKHEFLQIIKEPVKYEDGRVRGIIALINDVTEQETLKRKLEKLSFTDELTGLHNRAYMDSYMRTFSSSSYPITIMSADCDHLKVINDRYGHMVGDEYIRMSVTLMRSTLPGRSEICRTGGDEFLIFIPKTDEEKARYYLKRLEEMQEIFRIQDQKLSVSFGAATINEPGESFDQVIERSDAEMYRRKHARSAARNDL